MDVIRSIVVASLVCASLCYEIHYAINFGNFGSFNDSQGIVYEQEASSYTKTITTTKISGASDHDQKLYQSYTLDVKALIYYIFDVKESGRYLLVFKQFADSNRPFNVILNGQHQAVTKLSIYNEVGTYFAYDEYVYFSVCDDQLLYKNQKSTIKNNKISVEFKMVSGSYVYMSAMILVRGDVENYPVPSSLLYPQSKDAEISLLYQLSHKCAKNQSDVSIVPEKGKQTDKTQKVFVEPALGRRFEVNLSMNNLSFGNMNIFPNKGYTEAESDSLNYN